MRVGVSGRSPDLFDRFEPYVRQRLRDDIHVPPTHGRPSVAVEKAEQVPGAGQALE